MAKHVVCRMVDGKKKSVPISQLQFRPSVYGLIIKGQKILLVPMHDGYDFPGGGMHEGETIDEALRREVHEETGLWIKRGEILATESNFFYLKAIGGAFNAITIYYRCRVTGGQLTNKFFDPYEKKFAQKAEWVDLKRVPKLKFINGLQDSAGLIARTVRKQKVLK